MANLGWAAGSESENLDRNGNRRGPSFWIATSILFLIPLLDLLGWTLHIPWLVRIGDGAKAQNPLTALCFLSLGVAFMLSLGGALQRRVAKLLCVGIAAIGVVRVLCCFFGLYFPVDRLLFPGQISAEPSLNQMAWTAAACLAFIALGGVFVAKDGVRSAPIAQCFAGLSGCIALFIISTYVLQVVRNSSGLAPMSLNTAITVIVAVYVVSSLTSEQGFLRSISGSNLRARSARGMLIVSLVVPLGLTLLVERFQERDLISVTLGEAVVVTVTTVFFVCVVLVKSHFLLRSEIQVAAAEQNIGRSAAFLRSIIDAVPNPITVRDREGRFRLANAACAEIFCTTPEEMVGRPVSDFAKSQIELDFVQSSDKSALQSAGSLRIPREGITGADGNLRWLQTAKMQIPSADGTEMHLLAVATDITARIRAEDEAKRAAAEAQDLYDNAPCGYHTLNAEGTIVAINNTELKWLGYSREELVGKRNLSELAINADSFRQGFNKVRTLGQIQGVDSELVCKDGSILPVMINSSALYDGDGEFAGCRTTLFEISARKEAENEMLLAKAEAERANMAKSQFLSRMSHELRTPLNSILGFSQLMEMKGLEPADEECVSQILKAGRHLLQLINEVLDIARIETGNMVVSVEPIVLKEISPKR